MRHVPIPPAREIKLSAPYIFKLIDVRKKPGESTHYAGDYRPMALSEPLS
jgi:hypothetical protein